MRVAPSSMRLWGGVIPMVALLLSILSACARNVPQAATSADSIPPDLKEAVLARIADQFGPVSATYGEAVATRAEWHKLEPGLTSGDQLTDSNGNDLVYAVFVEGDFSVESLAPHDSAAASSPVRFVAGRVVVEVSTGRFLAVALWPEKLAPNEGFGERFDDQ